MILDANAGNRTMWQHKNSENIIYIDMERKLEVPPTMFCLNHQTPFQDKVFNAIFFDPPHNWGGAIHYFSFPSKAERKKVFPDATGIPTYYGWDKFKSRGGLVSNIFKAQLEFKRILKDDGLLYFKWNEMRITLNQILPAFSEWIVLMKLYINDPTHTAGEHQTYWVIMQKKVGKVAQQPLLDFL